MRSIIGGEPALEMESGDEREIRYFTYYWVQAVEILAQMAV